MNADYHYSILNNFSRNDSLCNEALMFYNRCDFLSALERVIETGDYHRYLQDIEDYDRFVWEKSKKGDKSNIFAYKKNKVTSSWNEQVWVPVFERIKSALGWENLVTLLNTKVVQIRGSDKNHCSYKDIDFGIGIKVDSLILPIIVCESKSGNFCLTTCSGVDGFFKRFKDFNPNTITIAVTDNTINVGRSSYTEHAFDGGDMIVMQRGLYLKSEESYPKLRADSFKKVESYCLERLMNLNPTDFTDIPPRDIREELLIDEIEKNEYFYVRPSI